jgi:hypothetical protein
MYPYIISIQQAMPYAFISFLLVLSPCAMLFAKIKLNQQNIWPNLHLFICPELLLKTLSNLTYSAN